MFYLIGIILIVGFIAADALIDYIFVIIYALAAVAIMNNIIHLIKYHKKHKAICSGDITSSLLYLLMATGAAVFQQFFL